MTVRQTGSGSSSGGGSGGGITEFASAARTTNLSVGPTEQTLVYQTVISDANSNYDNTTGVYTCPSDGNYRVRTAVNLFAAAGLTNIFFRVSGVNITNFYHNIGTGTAATFNEFTLNGLSASDTIEVRIRATNNSSLFGAVPFTTWVEFEKIN